MFFLFTFRLHQVSNFYKFTERFEVDPLTSSNTVAKFFKIVHEFVTKTLVLVIDESFEDAPITLGEVKIFGEKGMLSVQK